MGSLPILDKNLLNFLVDSVRADSALVTILGSIIEASWNKVFFITSNSVRFGKDIRDILTISLCYSIRRIGAQEKWTQWVCHIHTWGAVPASRGYWENWPPTELVQGPENSFIAV